MQEELDQVWKALADTTRRRILHSLVRGPLATTEIVHANSHLSRFGVMKHLEVLRAAGLIEVRPHGRRRLNRLRPARLRRLYEELHQRYGDHWIDGDDKPEQPPRESAGKRTRDRSSAFVWSS